MLASDSMTLSATPAFNESPVRGELREYDAVRTFGGDNRRGRRRITTSVIAGRPEQDVFYGALLNLRLCFTFAVVSWFEHC